MQRKDNIKSGYAHIGELGGGNGGGGRVLERRRLIYRIMREIIMYAAYVGIGYLLSTIVMPFNTRPLGIAVLASATSRIPALLCGAVIGIAADCDTPIIYICTYGALVLIRLFIKIMSETPMQTGGKRRKNADQRNTHKSGLFEDKMSARFISCLVISFVVGVYVLIAGGFRYYDLAGAFFSIGMSVAAVFPLSLCFDPELADRLAGVGSNGIKYVNNSKGIMQGSVTTAGKPGRFSAAVPTAVNVCRLALTAALIFSSRGLQIGIISVCAVSAFFATLYIGKDHGTLCSAACGLVLGVACGIKEAPLFMLAGAVSSMIYPISPLSAVITAGLCGSVWGTYIGGSETLLILLPSMSIAGVMILAFERITLNYNKIGKDTSATQETTGGAVSKAEDVTATKMLRDRNEQLKAMSGAFSSLSEVFYNLCDRMRRPGVLDLRRMCDGAFDKFCPGCPEREMCWGLEYSSTLEILNSLSTRLHTHGRVELSCLPEHLRERCKCTESIISEINRNCARMTEQALRSEKTEVFALDYEGMARILCDTLNSDDDEYDNNTELAERISAYLNECGLGQTTVICFGGRRKQIIARGISPFHTAIYSEHLREDIEKLSGYQLTGPSFERGDGFTPPSMVFAAKPKIKAECVCLTSCADREEIVSHEFGYEEYSDPSRRGTAFSSADDIIGNAKASTDAGKDRAGGEEVADVNGKKEFIEGKSASENEKCGDTINIFLSRKDYLYALISDGMGTGSEAAFTSEICSVFLEKMLAAGNSVETTLKMLNGLIRSKSGSSYGSECSATVDLMELDLLSGSASFIKSGAAQSYIVSGGNVYRLLSKTVPIGIIRGVDAQRLRFNVKDGDVIVMVSDGITEGDDDCVWLTDMLAAECGPETDHNELARKIILSSRRAAHLKGIDKYDDASVVIVKVSGESAESADVSA